MTSTYDENGIMMDRFADIVDAMNETAKADLGDSINLDEDSVFGFFRDINAITDARVNEIVQQVFDAGVIGNASGVHLDGAVGFVGLERSGYSYSTIEEVQITAIKACIVPVGTRYKTANNVNFATDTEIIFTGAGTDIVSATCTVRGPVNVGIGELNTIVNSIPGVTAVTNLTAAVPGTLRQTDPQLRNTHALVTATAGKNDIDSIYESLFEVPVDAALIIDNDSESYLGVIPPHSIRVIVIGGTDEDVATAIWLNRTSGVGMFGAESYTCYDPTYGNSKEIRFDRGADVSVTLRIYHSTTAAFPTTGYETIREAMAAIFEGYTLGSTVIYDQCKGACYAVPGMQLSLFTMETTGAGTVTADITHLDTERPTLDVVRDEQNRITSINVVFIEV